MDTFQSNFSLRSPFQLSWTSIIPPSYPFIPFFCGIFEIKMMKWWKLIRGGRKFNFQRTQNCWENNFLMICPHFHDINLMRLLSENILISQTNNVTECHVVAAASFHLHTIERADPYLEMILLSALQRNKQLQL